jgi:tryptophanyl-tRNA synthetase
MSKTYDNCVYLSDSPEEVEKKIKTMMTDPQRKRRTDKGDPELSPAFQLHKIFSTKEQQDEVAEGCRTAGIGCIDCKKVLIGNLFKVLEPIWGNRADLLKNPKNIEEIVQQGSQKAKKVASLTMQEVREAIWGP